MKKTLLYSLIILVVFSLASCSFSKKNEFPQGFFDTKPNGTSQTTKPDPVINNNNQKDSPEITEKSDEVMQKNPDKTKEGEELPNAPFSHSDKEKAEIISRYNEAEGLYYDILSQNFELDNMDVVTAVSDGYETKFHRVILGSVNSLSELRALYGTYFTASFIQKIDLSAYTEADGKLYCAPTSGSAAGKGTSYTAKVESIDEKNAVVVRKDSKSGGTQRISAVKAGGIWYFESVGIR